MKLRLTLNLGTVDAQKLGLVKEDGDKFKEGDIVDVKENVAEYLMDPKRKWAVPVAASAAKETATPRVEPAKPVTPVVVPTPPPVVVADAVKSPDFDAMNFDDLLAYATAHNVVSASAPKPTKNELLRLVKKHAGA